MVNSKKQSTNNYSVIFDEFEKQGVKFTQEDKSRIIKKMESILSYEPRIGIFGKTGAGKSSLCNALFGQDVAKISDTESCTRDTQEIILGIGTKGLKLIDVPGAGESRERDEEYGKLYKELLPELDLVLWLIKADDRAMASDEDFYKHIVKPHLDEGKPFFMVLNQVDKIEPFREWNVEKRHPGPKQAENIKEKIAVVSKYFDLPKTKIIEVSAHEKYNLVELVDAMTHELPKDKKITFLKSVEKENVSRRSRKEAETGFVDSVLEGIGKVAEKAIDFVESAASKVWSICTGGGCFITTATCLALGKGDKCPELESFRNYRDGWLSAQPDGKKLIEKYYSIAPKIVSAIDCLKDRSNIYKSIWKDHLSVCLKSIIEGKNEKACNEYIEMVDILNNKFIK